jgi:hypothetical protein
MSDLAVLVLWTVVGVVIALRRFSWTPASVSGGADG